MNIVQRLISAGFATAALAAATVPALAWSVWPDIDFESNAGTGKQAGAVSTLHGDDARLASAAPESRSDLLRR